MGSSHSLQTKMKTLLIALCVVGIALSIVAIVFAIKAIKDSKGGDE